jgi:hypothetical protein
VPTVHRQQLVLTVLRGTLLLLDLVKLSVHQTVHRAPHHRRVQRVLLASFLSVQHVRLVRLTVPRVRHRQRVLLVLRVTLLLLGPVKFSVHQTVHLVPHHRRARHVLLALSSSEQRVRPVRLTVPLVRRLQHVLVVLRDTLLLLDLVSRRHQDLQAPVFLVQLQVQED